MDEYRSFMAEAERLDPTGFAKARAEADELHRLQAEVEALRRDRAMLDWLEANPRIGEIVVNGVATMCYYYAVAGAAGVKLREIISAAMAARPGGQG